jgi:hypothetical protein
LRVGARDGKGKVQEWCRGCGLGWKCGKGAIELIELNSSN